MTSRKKQQEHETRAQRGAREIETPDGCYRLYGEIGCAHGVEKNVRCKACENERGKENG